MGGQGNAVPAACVRCNTVFFTGDAVWRMASGLAVVFPDTGMV